MSWPIDKSKLERVQQLMVQHDLDALVVRAPDNVLYLTNYWCMKGYDAVVFPRQGEATLIVLEPQLEDAQRNSWTRDLRLFSGYDERDPRPRRARHGAYLAASAPRHERERSRSTFRRLRARHGRRLQRQSRDGARVYSGVVRQGNKNFHCHRRSSSPGARANSV